MNENSTMQELLNYLNDFLKETNTNDIVTTESTIYNIQKKLQFNNKFSRSVNLLKGKRTVSIFNMIFKLKISKNKLEIKYYDWGEKWKLCNTVIEILNNNNYDLSITLNEAYNNYLKDEKIKYENQCKQNKENIEKFDRKIKELNIDIKNLSSNQLDHLYKTLIH